MSLLSNFNFGFQFPGLQFQSLLPSLPYILGGVKVTLTFTFVSLFFGIPLAIILAIFKVGKIKALRWLAEFYTSIFRGTPLLVQLSLIYFASPELTGYTISAFEAGVLTFSLNSAAYTSEVIRSGIQSLDKGQWEASQVLGLSGWQTFRLVIFPQAIRVIVPNLINEMIDLLKESALISIIGEADLMQRAKLVAAEKFLFFEPYLIAGILYYVMVCVISYFGKHLEKRLRYV
jgi:His/Glu/Gln/Arg/opine family amino acid ABC transporter permease subunit